MGIDDLFYLVEDEVCISRRGNIPLLPAILGHVFLRQQGVVSRNSVQVELGRERFVGLRLWQIGHHRNGVLTPIGHLVQVVENARVAPSELNTLWKEHRRVAMRVERQHSVVRGFGLSKVFRFTNEPLKQFESVFFEPFRMPLYAHNILKFAAFHGFNNAI